MNLLDIQVVKTGNEPSMADVLLDTQIVYSISQEGYAMDSAFMFENTHYQKGPPQLYTLVMKVFSLQ